MIRYFSPKEDKSNRTQITITLPKDAVDFYRSAIRGIKVVDPNLIISNSEMIEDIIYNRVNSKDIFYQVGDDTYTLQDLLITDLKDSFKDIKNKLIFEKMTIIKELDDVVNNLRAAYIIDHDNNMESDAYDQINDELTDSIKSYYDKHYFIENEEEIEESGNVISIVKLVRTNHNIEGNREDFVNKILEGFHKNKDYLHKYYAAALKEKKETILSKYSNQYIEEQEQNDIDKIARKLLEDSITDYYEAGLKSIKKVSFTHYTELKTLINKLTDEVVAEYIIEYGDCPIDTQYRLAEVFANERAVQTGTKLKVNSSDYLNAERILSKVIKKYNIDETRLLYHDLSNNDLELEGYIEREIKIEELEKEMDLKIIENKTELINIEEEIRLKRLELEDILSDLELLG